MTDVQSPAPHTSADSAAATFSAELWAAFWAAPDLSGGFDIWPTTSSATGPNT
ncbi:MAG TPA: hypothetical protein VER10_03140 [Mycobacterium sp.]|nr:hypothetical protein [Mycobacterium sp.]